MSETRMSPDEHESREPEDGEVIGRLLRLAGPRPSAPPEVERRVKEVVRARWRETVAARRRRRLLILSAGSIAAAATVVAVGVAGRRSAPAPLPRAAGPAGTVLLATGQLRGGDGAPIAAGATIASGSILETAGDARAGLRLAGGASLRMDRATRVALESGSLVDLERGAVYVDSGATPAGPGAIEVRTRLGLVRDIGTRFEVRVGDRDMRVRVRDGVVNVDRRGEAREVASGLQLTLDDTGAARTDSVARHGPEWDWVLDVAPGFALEGRTLGQLLTWVSVETGLRVAISEDLSERDVTSIELHGSLSGLRPDQAPETVLPTCGLTHRIEDDTLLILPAAPTGGR